MVIIGEIVKSVLIAFFQRTLLQFFYLKVEIVQVFRLGRLGFPLVTELRVKLGFSLGIDVHLGYVVLEADVLASVVAQYVSVATRMAKARIRNLATESTPASVSLVPLFRVGLV